MLKISGFLILVIIVALPSRMACANEARVAHGSTVPERRHALLRDALRQLQETYQAIHDPKLFLPIARLYFQLGDSYRALEHYRLFLDSAPDADLDDKKEAEAQVTQLTSVLGPLVQRPSLPAAMPPAPPILEEMWLPFEKRRSVRSLRRRNRGLIIAGSVMLSVAWTGALVAGVWIGLLAGDIPLGSPGYPNAAAKEKNVAGWMLLGLPVAGPIVTGITANDPVVSPLIAIVAGLPQFAGLAVIIGGATSNSFLNDKKRVADLHLLPFGGLSSAGLALSGTF